METLSGLTLEEFERRFAYDPQSGILTWKLPTKHGKPLPAGRPAGTVNEGYLVVKVGGNNVLASRIAWALYHRTFCDGALIFKNGDGTDIRIANLIEAINKQNQMATMGIPKHNTSGYKGVNWYSRYNCWRAAIRHRGRLVHLGYFKTARRAAAAYRLYAARNRGIFAEIGKQSNPQT